MDSTNSSAFSNWDIESIIQFLKDNILQVLLIILVFAIIYAVDHITNLNTILYAMPVLNIISHEKQTNKLPKLKEARKKSKR
jgi:hypothetical protein